MPWTENDAGGLSNPVIGNEINDGGGDDDRGIGEGKSERMQRQGPVGGGIGPTPMLKHPTPVPIVSQTTQPAVPTTLNKVDKEARSMVSTTGSPPSSDFLAPPWASTVSSAGSRSESNPQRHADAPSVPVPRPTGFRRMPRDPVSGRRICFYFNHTGCSAGARCAYIHVKTDIAAITPGAFRKTAVSSTPSSTGLVPSISSRPLPGTSFYSSWECEPNNHPPHHHSPSFSVGATLSSFPAPLPTYVPLGAPLSLPATSAYVMYYIGVPPSYPRSFPPSGSSSRPHICHGGGPPPVPTVLVGDIEERMQGRWGDAQWYHHHMQPGQQAAGAMDEEWAGGMVEVRGVDMQYHQQHAHYEQHYHYYPYQQMLQQDEQEVQKEEREQRQ